MPYPIAVDLCLLAIIFSSLKNQTPRLYMNVFQYKFLNNIFIVLIYQPRDGR